MRERKFRSHTPGKSSCDNRRGSTLSKCSSRRGSCQNSDAQEVSELLDDSSRHDTKTHGAEFRRGEQQYGAAKVDFVERLDLQKHELINIGKFKRTNDALHEE